MNVVMPVTVDVAAGMEPGRGTLVKQWDKGIRVLRVTLTNGGRRLEIPTGIRPVLSIKKPDGHTALLPGTAAGTYADFLLSPQTLPVAGRLQLEVLLLEGLHLLTSGRFTLENAASLQPVDLPSGDDHSVLEEARTGPETATEEAQAAVQAANADVEAAGELREEVVWTGYDLATFTGTAEYILQEVRVTLDGLDETLAGLATPEDLEGLKNGLQDAEAAIVRLKGTLQGKVDAEDGKGLSANDFTDQCIRWMEIIEQKLNEPVKPSDPRLPEEEARFTADMFTQIILE